MANREWAELRQSACVFEDEAILALAKPSGISVTGERHDTDLVRMAEASGERLFPAHRIDKATSGLILFAKDLAVHGGLTRQFNKRTVEKAYLVITKSAGLPARGTIELPLSAGRKGRVRIAAPREAIRFDPASGTWSVPDECLLDTRRYPSTTRIAAVWSDGEYSVLVARPVTGRRHQIRVHLAWIGHPVLGDPLFARPSSPAVGQRTCLHSWLLAFDAAWLGGRRTRLEAAPDPGFWDPLAARLPGGPAGGLLEKAYGVIAVGSTPR